MRHARPRARHGFTLVELAVVIALVATLASLALPSVAEHLARHRVKAAAQALVGDLAEARHGAAQRGQPLHVTFAGGADWCWAVTTTPDCDCRIAQACRLRAAGPAQWKGVTLGDAQAARFDPTGTGSGHAELASARGHRARVEVSALGRARLCSPQGALPGHPTC